MASLAAHAPQGNILVYVYFTADWGEVTGELVLDASGVDRLAAQRERIAKKMVLILPVFGRWASQLRDFETPYGKAGIRQLEVLYLLRHNILGISKPTATDMADHFGIQRSVLTRILVKLEGAGYITREPDVSDGRASRIAITETGQLLSDYVEREYFKEMARALGDIDEEDMTCVERSLTIFTTVSSNLGVADPAVRIGKDPE